jgi:hypothetical protein
VNGFTLLWSKILDSSIWMEDKDTRIVWITMLAMKDQDGIVRAARVSLAHRARVSESECEKALKVLSAPDPQSMTKDNEGRRIKEVPGGWIILNHELYRFSTEAKREFWRQQKADQRESKKAREARLTSEARERRFKKALDRGDQAAADRIAAEGLPERKK